MEGSRSNAAEQGRAHMPLSSAAETLLAAAGVSVTDSKSSSSDEQSFGMTSTSPQQQSLTPLEQELARLAWRKQQVESKIQRALDLQRKVSSSTT